ARRAFAADLPKELKDEIAFFDATAYTPGATIQDNILFGKLVYGQANAANRVGALVAEILDEMGLRDTIMLVGLGAETGSGGSRLSPAQRQKIAIARALLKQPGILLVHDATVALDAASQARILQNVLSARKDATVIWTASNPAIAEKFERVAVMEGGRVVETGSYHELSRNPGSKLAQMLQE
ncbi:MAG: ATP-binding cassette domain-containing protein, partial [Alphaproteobacteria bacterium]|nr:ATP-binding cassette domain-containing protein [Alphaproteobacteria bacterium]